ncbi:hypothetical protein EVAR_16397_1 [Eumeta japonica]|uniref:Uncharacterized protein n=1 Tax=Eumeta variegata TaxID=151549 RepID=A0A4C1VU96_EUMVA|nr:hypothetical protein EVAR_16397_1 [Eumeta japonica]
MAMYLAYFTYERSLVDHPRPQWSQLRDGRLILASCPGVAPSGIPPRRIQVGSGSLRGRGAFHEVPSLVSSTDQALLRFGEGVLRSCLGKGRPLGDLSCLGECSRGIHEGLDRRCRTSGEYCAG